MTITGAEATQEGGCLDATAEKSYGTAIQSAQSCAPSPTIIDLPFDAFQSNFGPYPPQTTHLSCCKNGTLGLLSFPKGLDPAFRHYQYAGVRVGAGSWGGLRGGGTWEGGC